MKKRKFEREIGVRFWGKDEEKMTSLIKKKRALWFCWREKGSVGRLEERGFVHVSGAIYAELFCV